MGKVCGMDTFNQAQLLSARMILFARRPVGPTIPCPGISGSIVLGAYDNILSTHYDLLRKRMRTTAFLKILSFISNSECQCMRRNLTTGYLVRRDAQISSTSAIRTNYGLASSIFQGTASQFIYPVARKQEFHRCSMNPTYRRGRQKGNLLLRTHDPKTNNRNG